MVSVMIQFAVFFGLLFILLPSVLIFLVIVRESFLQSRKQAGWEKKGGGELVG